MAKETAEEFNAKLGSIFGNCLTGMSIELGTRLGLFDYMVNAAKPMTCQEIADGLNFKERYVREWLGVVVMGGIVDVSNGKYSIPEHRRKALNASDKSNQVIFYWLVSTLSGVTNDLMECFKKDGPKGLPYSKYPMFHPWREVIMKTYFTEEEVMLCLDEIPGLKEKLESGIKMADFGCSTGASVFYFAKMFPKTQIYGYDIGEDAIKFAQEKAKKLGVENIHFAVQDVCEMPADWSESFDFAFAYDVVHDVPRSDKFLNEMCRVLKPGCPASITDTNTHSNIEDNLDIPYAGMLYGCSLFHCMTVSLHDDGLGLGAAWGVEKAQELMKAAGFSKVQTKPLKDFQILYTCFR